MTRQLLSLVLVALLVTSVGLRPARAGSREDKRARHAEKVKANILKLGTGAESRVKVRLLDKTKVEGYLSAAGDETFTVISPETGLATTVAYPQVGSVRGNNLSTGAKIAIGAGVAAAVVLLIFWKVVVDDD